MRYAPIIIIAIIVVALAFILGHSQNSQPVKELIFEPRMNEVNGVTITVQPKVFADAAWSFEITMDTHSVELPEDVMVAVLADETGRKYKVLAWTGDPPGGHHRKGVLKFEPISPAPKTITLNLGRIGNTERTFVWELQ